MLPYALSDTAAISIAGIAVSGVIGPGVAARWARKRQADDHKHAHIEKEHDDLTALLDSAAVTLASGVTRLRKARRSDDPGLEVWASEVHATYERLLLRVPVEDPVAVGYKAARDRLSDLADVIAAGGSSEDEEDAMVAFEQARSSYLDQARACLLKKAPSQ